MLEVAAQTLDLAAVFLGFQSPFFGRARRPGRPARLGPVRGLPDEPNQAIERVLPVLLLRSILLRLDHEYALLIDASPGHPYEPGPDILR